MLKNGKKSNQLFFLLFFVKWLIMPLLQCCSSAAGLQCMFRSSSSFFLAFSAEFYFNEHFFPIRRDLTAWKLSSNSRVSFHHRRETEKTRKNEISWVRQRLSLFSLHLIQSHYPRLDFAISLRFVSCVVSSLSNLHFFSSFTRKKSTFVTIRII